MKKIIFLPLFLSILGCNNREVRDLNKNEMLDIYEDISQSIDDRVNDLISQMTIEEKAGSIFIDITKVTFEGSESSGFASFLPKTAESINNLQMNHFNIIDSFEPTKMLEWYNNIQKVAEESRLGIPITIASDPRHGAPDPNSPISVSSSSFSVWPSTLGLGAIADEEVVEEAGGFQVLKEKFIEGGYEFMSLVLIALILGLAFCIERIITLNIASGINVSLIT